MSIDFNKSAIIVAHFDDELILYQSLLSKVKYIRSCIYAIVDSDLDNLRTRLDYGYKVDSIWKTWEHYYVTPKLQGAFDTLNLAARDAFFLDNNTLYNKIKEELVLLKSQDITDIITHSPWGGYGHAHHTWVFSHVYQIAKELDLNVWCHCQYRPNSNVTNVKWVLSELKDFDSDIIYVTYDERKAAEYINIFNSTHIDTADAWTWHDLGTGDITGEIFPDQDSPVIKVYEKNVVDLVNDPDTKDKFKAIVKDCFSKILFTGGLRKTEFTESLLAGTIENKDCYFGIGFTPSSIYYWKPQDSATYRLNEDPIIYPIDINYSTVQINISISPFSFNFPFLLSIEEKEALVGNGKNRGTNIVDISAIDIVNLVKSDSTLLIYGNDVNTVYHYKDNKFVDNNGTILYPVCKTDTSSQCDKLSVTDRKVLDDIVCRAILGFAFGSFPRPTGIMEHLDKSNEIILNYSCNNGTKLKIPLLSVTELDPYLPYHFLENEPPAEYNIEIIPGSDYATVLLSFSDLKPLIYSKLEIDPSIIVKDEKIYDKNNNLIFPCEPSSCVSNGGSGTGNDGGTVIDNTTSEESSNRNSVYPPTIPKLISPEEQIEKRLKEIKHPSDLTFFEFNLLAADYINSYSIPKNIQQIVENVYPNIFMDQSRKTNLPLSSHPFDAGSMYQFFRTPKFDNISCLMEDTLSQPFNSYHFYFNSNKNNTETFGGIDSSSPGSSHRTKVIVNSNVSGYIVPQAKDGTGYVTNNVNSGGIHVYTADNFFMTVDREFHTAINGSAYLKVGNNLNLIVGSRKNKPSYNTIPSDFYKETGQVLPEQEANIEVRNNLNILSHENQYTKITSTSSVHLRVTHEQFLSNKNITGEPNYEFFNEVDHIEDRCNPDSQKNLYITVSDEIHIVSGGLLRMSVGGLASSVPLPIDANGAVTIRSYKDGIALESHNGGNIGLSTIHEGDISLYTNYAGGISMKTYDGDIVSYTDFRGSIYNVIECDGDIKMIIKKKGSMELKTFIGDINVETTKLGLLNFKTSWGDIKFKTDIRGDFKVDTQGLINFTSHGGDINIIASSDNGCPSITLSSATAITIDAPSIFMNGNVYVAGELSACKIIGREDVKCGNTSICVPASDSDSTSDSTSEN